MSKNFVVRFAGEGGQGVVGGSEILAAAAAQVGYHVLTFATYPSQIKGGPAWGQARISTGPILSSGDYVDILVALNRYAYDHNIEELREAASSSTTPRTSSWRTARGSSGSPPTSSRARAATPAPRT